MTSSPEHLTALSERLRFYSDDGQPAPHRLRTAAIEALQAVECVTTVGYVATNVLALALLVASVEAEAAALEASQRRRPLGVE